MMVRPGVTRAGAAALLLALLGLLVAACGSGSSDDGKKADSQKLAKTARSATGATGATGATAATGSTGIAGRAAGSPLDGRRFFAADSPWNTRVDDLPVAPDSARMLALAMRRRAAREVPGRQGIETFVRRVRRGLFINTDVWAPLIVSADAPEDREIKFVCRQSRCGTGPPTVPKSITVPASTTPDPRYDGWLSVIDREKNLGYDFWRARRQTDDLISYQYAKAWTLNGPGFSRPVEVDPGRAVGARGSGLPLFAGVINPVIGVRGRIDHALAISVPGLARRNYVQPASVTDGVGSTDSLPAGARIRLRSTVTADRRDLGIGRSSRKLRGERRALVESILEALREYGAIVVDRAAVPTLYAPKGTSPRVLSGGELSWLSLQDFEVIQLPKIYKDPPLAKVTLEGPATGESGSTGSTGSTGREESK